MAEYIERQAVFDALPIVKEDKEISLYGAVADFMVLVSALPAADVEPVRHGRWIITSKYSDIIDMEVTKYTCSVCGEYRLSTTGLSQATNHCPHCGARMEIEDGTTEKEE